jgi:hypothetical protein
MLPIKGLPKSVIMTRQPFQKRSPLTSQHESRGRGKPLLKLIFVLSMIEEQLTRLL